MFIVHGHKVDKVGFSQVLSVSGYNEVASRLMPLKAVYKNPSAAKRSIYSELEGEFSDACEYGICASNCEFFTFRAVYTWGYITVYPTRREAKFWDDSTDKDKLVKLV